MDTIKIDLWPLAIIGVILLLAVFSFRSGSRKSNRRYRERKAIIPEATEPGKLTETDREPINRDFNNVDSLVQELDNKVKSPQTSK